MEYQIFKAIYMVIIAFVISIFVTVCKKISNDFLESNPQINHSKREYVITFLLTCFLSILIFTLTTFLPSSQSTKENDISIKIERISSNLAEASDELSDIQKELEKRIEFVETLKEEAEIAENVISLSEEQVNAVQSKLNDELNANNAKGLLQDILIGISSAILGALIPVLFNYIKKKRNMQNEDKTEATHLNKYSDDEIEQIIQFLNSLKQKKDLSNK